MAHYCGPIPPCLIKKQRTLNAVQLTIVLLILTVHNKITQLETSSKVHSVNVGQRLLET